MTEYEVTVTVESALGEEMTKEWIAEELQDMEGRDISVHSEGKLVHVGDGQQVAVGRSFPAIDVCPADGCDCQHFSTTTVSKDSKTFTVNENGSVINQSQDVFQDQFVVSVECRECDTVVMEDGELIDHDTPE